MRPRFAAPPAARYNGCMAKGHWLTIVLSALAILSLLYVAAYYATVKISVSEMRVTNTHLAFFNSERAADYRIGGRAARIIFSPIHELDRRLRSSVWSKDYIELKGELERP